LPRKQGKPEPGCLVVNPFSFVRRTTIDASELPNLPAEGRPIYAVGRSGERKQATIDAPSMGFAWVPAGASNRDPKPLPLPLAEEGVLRNEFFEAIVSRETGGLAAIKEYEKRTNRLSQQLAFRLPGRHPQPGGEYRGEDRAAAYSLMAADSVETVISNTVMGEIVTRGRLLTRKEETLAAFTQRYRVYRGSRVIHVEVELDPKEECRSDPWSSYYCARFAWANEGASLSRAVNLSRQAAGAKRLEAPLYVEIEDGELRTTILTGGLPFHRRTDYRMLDSLLVVRGETARTFRFGIGVELKNSLQEALSFLAPAPHLFQSAPPPANASSWLFHVDARNVAATWWSPLIDAGRVAGVRVRLLENAGRPAKLKLQSFRPFAAARQVDFLGQTMNECPLEDGAVRLELAAGEWMEVEARFTS
jgi:alpha-mannosidase